MNGAVNKSKINCEWCCKKANINCEWSCFLTIGLQRDDGGEGDEDDQEKTTARSVPGGSDNNANLQKYVFFLSAICV